MKQTIAALTLSLLAVPALAKEAPTSLTPASDAAVTYAVQGPGRPEVSMIIAWNRTQDKMRIDAATLPGWVLSEPRENRAFIVVDEQRRYMALPANAAREMEPRLPPGVRLTEAGSDTVAGLPCTVWNFEGAQPGDGDGSICMTDANLLLRLEGKSRSGQGLRMEAQTVATGPQDAARFTLPQGYQQITPQQGAAPAR